MENKKEFKLPKEFAEEWLKALRSGNYKQCKGKLYNDTTKGYCCLGVACILKYPLHYLKNCNNNGFAGTITKYDSQKHFVYFKMYMLKYDLKKIPEGLKGRANDNRLVEILTEMNDNGKSFNQIANWIEKNIELI